ncbi:Sulfotransferase domain protein [Roseovarius albus]|uniref:Sulfotransferase domain protein n=1 Tax=Roseovarius albus TaxID=1247867 RepID=A0A1X6ZWA1_9RHOB|nr:sulfotransferase domain-containing protein [Roseovarius albus]SLN63695.1 Sulfotransferase domain protein [Roseovarius albus]
MTKARPTTIEGMRENMKGFATDEGVHRGLTYKPDPTDIFISPYAKCGTTWMQQIVHGLRTGGVMDFAEITEVVPWLELAHDMGVDINAPQAAVPRAFKSHLNWENIPKGGRYIVVLRDPLDAFVSLYKFLDGWHFESGSISLPDFAEYFLNREPSNNYWGHLSGWWEQRHNLKVMLLSFEDMKQDLPAVVKSVADFMGVADQATIDVATHQAGFEFMKAHPTQFDDHLLRQARDAACNLPADGVSTKVSQGKSGAGRQMVGDEIRAAFARRWSETIEREYGLPNYAALRQAIKQNQS